MKKTKVAYIIPGSGESPDEKAYKQISYFFRKKGIKPIPIKINWKYKLMPDYIEQFRQQAKVKNPDYVLGFSFGAMIALISANEIKPKKLILCSLAPWFKEDLPKLKKSWLKLAGKRQVKNLKKYSFKKISRKIISKTILIYGSKEAKELENKVKETHKKIKNSELIAIPKVKHKIADERYLKTISDVIKSG